MPSLATRSLAGGLDLTVLRLGGTGLGDMYTADDTATAVATVEDAFARGIRCFDTAPVYRLGLAESRLGAAARTLPRDEIVISSKVGYDLGSVPRDAVLRSGRSREHGSVISRRPRSCSTAWAASRPSAPAMACRSPPRFCSSRLGIRAWSATSRGPLRGRVAAEPRPAVPSDPAAPVGRPDNRWVAGRHGPDPATRARMIAPAGTSVIPEISQSRTLRTSKEWPPTSSAP